MNYIDLIFGFIGGGGLITLLTIGASRRKANAEADSTVTDNYEKLVERLEHRQDKMDEKMDVMSSEIVDLKQAVLAAFRCPIITQHPDDKCPVQEAYNQLQKED